MAWRRKWLLVMPLALAAASVAVYSRTLPDLYRSTAVILVVPQRVPEKFVQSTVTAGINERLQAIMQVILSRARLERVVQEFDLYPEARRTGIMEDIIDRMRRDIAVEIARDAGRGRNSSASFHVSYASPDPQTAMRVTERLASHFIEENLRERASLAEGTDEFLESQLADARRELVKQEKQLEEYRQTHAWSMPGQLQTNTWVLQNLQQKIDQIVQNVMRLQDRRLASERLIEALTLAEAAIPPAESTTPGNKQGRPQTLSEQLEAARSGLRAMELRLKPEHPDVVRARRAIAELEKKAEQEALTQPLAPTVNSSQSPVAAAGSSMHLRMVELRSTIENIDRQIAALEAEKNEAYAEQAEYRKRVEATPTRQAELSSLTRDYETIKNHYEQLLSKKTASGVATELERRQVGEQFRVIDPPRIPQRPFSPNRGQWIALGALGGLGLGLLWAGILEYRDSSLRTEEDVVVSLSLPVLAVAPLVRTTRERRRLKWVRALGYATGSVAVIGSAATIVWALMV